MAGKQIAKTILHASAVEGKLAHRWIVAAFASETAAGMYAGLLKSAHVTGDAVAIAKLDPNHHSDSDGKPLTPIKLSVQTVPYNPHATIASGLDED